MTPQARVAVATNTWIFMFTYSSSTVFLSRSTSPAWWIPIPKERQCLRLVSLMLATTRSISCSSMCSHCFSLPTSAPRCAIRSCAVTQVWRREATNTSTGLVGLCCLMPWKAGLVMLAILGQ